MRVRRDGKLSTILAKKLVPGDIVALELEALPADIKLLPTSERVTRRICCDEHVNNVRLQVRINMSALTGESMPVTVGPGEPSPQTPEFTARTR